MNRLKFCKLSKLTKGTNSRGFSFLVANLPPMKIFVRKEYLTQFQFGHGEIETGYWVSLKSKTDRAYLFETLLSEYGALYDKLPISAFLWRKNVNHSELLPLEYLQLWNCSSYYVTVIEKQLLNNFRVSVLMKNGKTYRGTYVFTIDNCHVDKNILITNESETPEEHKSSNLIKLDNGQFCIQPNNRIIWDESSLTPKDKLKPYFKLANVDYKVGLSDKWSANYTDSWDYSDSKITDNNN